MNLDLVISTCPRYKYTTGRAGKSFSVKQSLYVSAGQVTFVSIVQYTSSSQVQLAGLTILEGKVPPQQLPYISSPPQLQCSVPMPLLTSGVQQY